MNCPYCNRNIDAKISEAISERAREAAYARLSGLSANQRSALARKGGLANLKRSKAEKAATRALLSASMKAAWARRKAKA